MKLALSIDEAAEAAGYSPDTIRRQIAAGNITARYANTKPVILVTELTAWLESLPAEAPKR